MSTKLGAIHSEGILFLEQDSFSLSKSLRDQVELLSFLDVLEHVENPKEFINKHIKYFPNAKWIIVTLPARQEIYSNYDLFFNHYKRYSLEDCNLLFNEKKMLTCQYFFHLLYFPALLLKLMGMKRKTRISPPPKLNFMLKYVHTLLAKYFIVESRIIPKKFFGSSILCVIEL